MTRTIGAHPEDSSAEGSSAVAREAVLLATVAAPTETAFEDVAARVAEAVAQAEPPDMRAKQRDVFASWIRARAFLPNLPTLANAGRGGQLAACFVLRPDDSLSSIYEALGHAALIQQGAGGSGIDFSQLRPNAAPIERSGGVSPGPVAFVEVFAHSAQVVSCAGRRAGAHLAILPVDHPDVLDFVRLKAGGRDELSGIGLALAASDAFLNAAARDQPIELRDPRGGVCGELNARELLEEVAHSIHLSGEPSLLFIDTIARGNPVPELGPIRATNPCGEQPLLPYESCVLGSLHLPAFAEPDGELQHERLASAVRDAIRFLDDVIDVNTFPVEQIADATRRTRKVGLGIMGFADLLLLRGLPYGSAESLQVAHEVLSTVRDRAREASQALAEERGAYPAFGGRGPALRNATQLAIAPTGTLRLIAGCSGGIEPFLRPVLRIHAREGTLRWVDRWLEGWLAARDVDLGALLEALERQMPSRELPGLGERERELLRLAWEVDPARQIELQAAFQRYVDGAVSKTVHLPPEASTRTILSLIRLAHTQGCKGVSFYRRGCAACGSAVSESDVDIRLPMLRV